MTTESVATRQAIMGAQSYVDIFGASTDDMTNRVRLTYRRLARIVHPDSAMPTDKAIATATFQRLNELHDAAVKAIASNTYGVVSLAVFTTKHAEHRVIRPVSGGDLCDVYEAATVSGNDQQPTVLKLARDPGDADLMEVEGSALRHLLGTDGDPKVFCYLPKLIESFTDDTGRPAHVLGYLDGFYTLEHMRRAFPHGVHPLDMAWMWRRILYVLGYVHSMRVVHGAVLPMHVLIEPTQHGVVLVDWCYSSMTTDGNPFSPLKAIVERYRAWYPRVILDKYPLSPAADIAMAARCMVDLMGGDAERGSLVVPTNPVPVAMQAFFKGCLSGDPRTGPTEAYQLLGEFDQLLERLGGDYYPRKFRPFVMPRGIA